MKHHLQAAQQEVAHQLAAEERPWCDMGAVKRLMGTVVLGAGIALGNASPAQASDNETIGAVVGGALGTLVGVKATQKQNDYFLRSTGVAATAAVGTYLGKKLGSRFDAPPAQPQHSAAPNGGQYDSRAPVREVVIVERVERPRHVESYVGQRGYDRSPANYQRPADIGWEARGQAPGDVSFAARSAGFNPVLCEPLERHNRQLFASGEKSLNSNTTYKSRLAQVAEELLRSAQNYGRQIEAWDDAATMVGLQGETVRLKVADHLVAAQRHLDGKVLDYAQVRNAMARQGYDVREIDSAVMERTQNLRKPDSYEVSQVSIARPLMR